LILIEILFVFSSQKDDQISLLAMLDTNASDFSKIELKQLYEVRSLFYDHYLKVLM